MLNKCTPRKAVVFTNGICNAARVFKQFFPAFYFDDTVYRTAAAARACNRHFSACKDAVCPGRGFIHPSAFRASGAPCTLREHIDVLVKLPLVLYDLQLVQYQRQTVYKRRRLFPANRSAVECVDETPDFRVCPYAGCQHKAHGLAGFRASPKVYEERQTAQRLYKHRRKRRCKDNAGKYTLLPDAACHAEPFFHAAAFFHALKKSSKICVSVKYKFFYVGRKTLIFNPSQAAHTVFFRDPIIVQRFEVIEILYQVLCAFRRHSDAHVCKLQYLICAGQHAFFSYDFAPLLALSIGNLKLLCARVDVYEPQHRHDRMIARLNIRAIWTIRSYPKFIRHPAAGIQFHFLSIELRDIRHHDLFVFDAQAVYVCLIEFFEAVHADRFCPNRHLFQRTVMYKRVCLVRINILKRLRSF